MVFLVVNPRWTQQELHLTMPKGQRRRFRDQVSPRLVDHAAHTQSRVLAEKRVIEEAGSATASDVGVPEIQARKAGHHAIAQVVVHLRLVRQCKGSRVVVCYNIRRQYSHHVYAFSFSKSQSDYR